MNATPAIETALAELNTAEAAHVAILRAKFSAAGKRIGSFAPEIENDADVVAAFARVESAQSALEDAEQAARVDAALRRIGK